LVEAFNALRLFRRETEEAPVAPSRALGVAGVPAPAAELRGFAAPDKVPDSLETPELVRPPVAVPALAVAGVSTARALCIGEPGLGPPDGLVRVGDEGRWLCPPGFAACARAPRETTGRAGAVPVAGRARAGARDPSLAPVHDADAHDAAIVSFVFQADASKRVCLSHAARERGGPAGGKRGANAARRTRVWKRSAASPKDVRRW
jgi:hypothetical protein